MWWAICVFLNNVNILQNRWQKYIGHRSGKPHAAWLLDDLPLGGFVSARTQIIRLGKAYLRAIKRLKAACHEAGRNLVII